MTNVSEIRDPGTDVDECLKDVGSWSRFWCMHRRFEILELALPSVLEEIELLVQILTTVFKTWPLEADLDSYCKDLGLSNRIS